LATPQNLIDSIKQTLREPVWAVLVITAIIAGIFDAIFVGFSEIGEVISIVLMTLFLIAVTSIADLVKDKKFVQL
jgi:hypothetical protein